MNSHATNPLRKSKHSMLTIALLITTVLFAAGTGNAQQLQPGISVQLAVTSSAAPVPDADNEGAAIVSVTESGSVFFGINPITPAALAGTMAGRQKLYIKADARTAYANVEKILAAAHAAGLTAPILLTSQSDPSGPGMMVPPKGLEVLLGPPSPAEATLVQIANSGQQTPTLRVNNRPIPWANLQNLLTQLFQNRPEKVVLVKADGVLSLAEVVHVIDVCRSTDAKVVVATPTL